MSENIDRYKKRSAWWFLLPIFFTIFGGLIAYFAIRSDDAKRAKDCLLLGIILFAIPLALVGIMMAFFSVQMSEFEHMMDPYCTDVRCSIWEI
jgi:hypothetical protein